VHSHHNLEEELEYLESSYWPHPFWWPNIWFTSFLRCKIYLPTL
jgi:hypothetical protein